MGATNAERDDRPGSVRQPIEHSLELFQLPEIVGQVDSPAIEAIRRLWRRALDRVCYCVVLIRLSIRDRICEA